MPEAGLCPTCGSMLATGGTCSACNLRQGRPLTLGSEAGVIVILTAIAVVFFLLTSAAVNEYRAKERKLGKEWAEKGHAFLKTSQPSQAVEAFQTSLRYQPTAQDVRYAMVDSLLAAGRSEQARSYLLSLWERQPASGIINLDLARIAAQRNDVDSATRYYHNAIYGIWPSSTQQQRTQTRLELVRFLLRHKAQRDADAELLALAANAPASRELSLEIGERFLEANDPDSAFDQFSSALKGSPRDPELLAGAGKAAFARSRYAEANAYLEKARNQQVRDPEVERLYQLSRLILDNDPFDRRVSWQTRSSRTLANLATAGARLQQCEAQFAGGSGTVPPDVSQALASIADARKHATPATLRRNPDQLIRLATLAFSAEETAAKLCSPPQGVDEALLLIGRHHPEAAP